MAARQSNHLNERWGRSDNKPMSKSTYFRWLLTSPTAQSKSIRPSPVPLILTSPFFWPRLDRSGLIRHHKTTKYGIIAICSRWQIDLNGTVFWCNIMVSQKTTNCSIVLLSVWENACYEKNWIGSVLIFQIQSVLYSVKAETSQISGNPPDC
jgi:hypothetical protein